MKQGLIVTICTFLLIGCVSLPPSLPDEYKGEVAKIQDTEYSIDAGKADLFYLAAIDGAEINNSRIETMQASYEKGNFLSVVLLNNRVPVGRHRFTIVGRTEYAMPIRALIGDVYEVKGEVEFSPRPNVQYSIRGKLSEAESTVWIEDTKTRKVIGRVVSEGSSKLGVFQK